MTGVRTSAPGKVVVCGEYAVLDGAAAIVMAVDRRARVRVSQTDAGWHRVSAPGHSDQPCDFRINAAGDALLRDAAEPSFDLSLVASVWRAVGVAQSPSLLLDLDTRPFFDAERGEKLGIGSSAALAVALTAALLHRTNDPRDAAALALAAHRDFQGGRGSGVDIAAAIHGGVVAYRATDDVAAEALSWPDGLYLAVLWSGRPASTVDKVARFRQSTRRRSARTAASRLARAAEDVLVAWRSSETPAILDALTAYTRALQLFSVDHDLGVFDAGHRELRELAVDGHVVYKPCGAGGGDIGIVLTDREASLMDFIESAVRRGFERLNLALDTRGVETG